MSRLDEMRHEPTVEITRTRFGYWLRWTDGVMEQLHRPFCWTRQGAERKARRMLRPARRELVATIHTKESA